MDTILSSLIGLGIACVIIIGTSFLAKLLERRTGMDYYGPWIAMMLFTGAVVIVIAVLTGIL